VFLEVWSAFGAGVGLLVGAVVVAVRVRSGSGEVAGHPAARNFWARGRIAIRKLYGIDSLRSQSLVVRLLSNATRLSHSQDWQKL